MAGNDGSVYRRAAASEEEMDSDRSGGQRAPRPPGTWDNPGELRITQSLRRLNNLPGEYRMSGNRI